MTINHNSLIKFAKVNKCTDTTCSILHHNYRGSPFDASILSIMPLFTRTFGSVETASFTDKGELFRFYFTDAKSQCIFRFFDQPFGSPNTVLLTVSCCLPLECIIRGQRHDVSWWCRRNQLVLGKLKELALCTSSRCPKVLHNQ